MTTRVIRKEMDFQGKPQQQQQQVPQQQIPQQQAPMQQMPQQQVPLMQGMPQQMPQQQQPMQQFPSQDAPVAPQQQQPGMQDHTHPEYDQMMVKMQELETELQDKKMGGIQQEGLEEGAPEDDAGKPKGQEKDPKNVLVEKIARRVIEELKGMPERDIGKTLDKSGPEAIDGIPQSQQPDTGTAPSGGGFDSDDKLNEEDGNSAIAKAKKPASEFPKQTIQKNKLKRAKMYVERAKRLIKEANGEDPTTPNPGAEEDKPKPMEGAVQNQSPTGGTEVFGDDEEEEEEKQQKVMVENTYQNIMSEIKKEKVSQRQTLVGMSSDKKSNRLTDAKADSSDAIKEYLMKAGQGSNLGYTN